MLSGLVVAPLLPATPAAADPPTPGTTIVNETFSGASVPDPAWVASGTTCLTGASAAPPAGAAQLQTCAASRNGPVPALGATPGYLQFTDASVFKAGSILYQRPIPATAGISVVFEEYQYGGNEADGIGFFLADGASTASQVGGDGGSLGYAQRNTIPGVPGGYLGVGLDAYGNFYDDGEARGRNCPAGQRSPAGTAEGRVAPNVITLRGPGNGLNGYCWLAATTTNDGTNPVSTLPGSLRGTPGPGNNLTPVKRLVNVQVTPAPGPRVIVLLDVTGTGTAWQQVLNVPAPAGTPSTYKFGFLGSTGGNTDVHLIRNVVVGTINQLDSLQLVKQVSRSGTPLPAVITVGTGIPYQYVVTNAGLETLTNLTVTDNNVTAVSCPTTTLPPEPDPGGTVVCTGTHIVTAGDVAAGSVVNTATAHAVTPGGPVDSPNATVTVPLVSALSISKQVNTPGPYAVGQLITYGFTVQNTGGSRLTQVSVVDNRVGTGRVVCALTSLDPGGSTACTGPYTIALADLAPGGLLTNTAFATGVSPIGQPVQSPTTTATVAVAADIALSKSVSNTAPAVGTTVTWLVTAGNLGPSAAGQVIVTDVVPPGLTLLSATPSAGAYTPGTGAWVIPAIAINGSVTLTLTTRVDTAAAITNGASVTTTQVPDPNPANNTASATLNSVVPTADIAVTKRASQPQIRVGQTVTFVVTATNNGPFDATDVVVNDGLPTDLTLISATPSRGGYNAGTVLWQIGALAVGQTVTLTIVAQGNAVGTVLNTAAVVGSSPVDSNSLNNLDSAAVQIVAPLVDLVTTKTVSPTTAAVGDIVTYTLTAFDNGPDNVDNVDVRELGTAPPGLDIVSVTASQGTFDEDNLVWTVGTLIAGAPPQTLTVQVRVLTPGTKGNTVVIEAPNINDPVPENNVASATLVGAALPLDIVVGKSASAAVVQRGQPISFTVTATNNGPNDATGLVLRDELPPGFTFDSAVASLGGYDPVSTAWTIGALASGSSVSLQITATAAQIGSWVNVAALNQVDQRDTDPADNSALVPVVVDEEADLVITKSVEPAVATLGDLVTYTVTVTNDGPNDTSEVQAVDPERLSADIVDVTVSQGTFDGPTRVWTIGSLAPHQQATLIATVRIDRVGTTVNTVQITQTSTPDLDIGNNTARATLRVPAADLSVTKTASAPAVSVGQPVVFTVTAGNTGPDTAAGVTAVEAVPPGFDLVSATPTTGVYDVATGVWTIGDMLPGATETLVLEVIAQRPGTFTNQVMITAAGPMDPDPQNNTAAVTVTIAGLAITPTPTPTVSPPVGPGQPGSGQAGAQLGGTGRALAATPLAPLVGVAAAFGGLLILVGLSLAVMIRRERTTGRRDSAGP